MSHSHGKPDRISKTELRAAALARRDALSPALRAEGAEALAVRPLPFALAPGAIVAGYAPIRSELDPYPLMHALQARGAALALPVVTGRGKPLLFRRWTFGDPLVAGHFGILEPAPVAPEVTPEVLLVPLAAFDRAGHRIGYGGGFYDRTLAAAGRALAIGLAFSTQEVAAVDALPHDVRLAYIATERETFAAG